MKLIEPIDQLHSDSIHETDKIRRAFQKARDAVARWEPRPYQKESK